jgi:2-polyprenyl-3-methyl-5-hydroxy-6-metoxy-1,4-benzoquinol methylase
MSYLRVVPGITPVENVGKHVARYNLAMMYCQNARVLDAACGSGYGTRILSMVAKEVVGWDSDKEAVDYALSHFGAENSAFYTVDLQRKIKKNLVGVTSPFDAVVSLETLEHLEKPEKAVELFEDLLRPNGFIIASVPLNEFKGQNEHHLHTYTLQSARDLFLGFNPIDELVQHSLSFYPVDVLDSFPDEPVYYLFVGSKR